MAVSPEDNNNNKNPLIPEDDAVDPVAQEAKLAGLNDGDEETPSYLKQINPGAPGEVAETEALNKRLDSIKEQIGPGENFGSGLFKNGKGGKSGEGAVSFAKKLGGNRRALFGVGGGAIGLVLVAGSIFGTLNTFKLDNFFKTVEHRTSQRLMASLDVRNRYLVRSYIEVRVSEIEGATSANDNLFFKSDKVDTQSPFWDWYRTMRNSDFESKLLKQEGIAFVSMVDSQGHVKVGKVTGANAVDPKLSQKYLGDLHENGDNLISTLNSIPSDDLEKIFTVDTFDSHKAARAAVKDVVNERIPWWRVNERLHARKYIQNVTGIKSWRLFEKTRDTIAQKKQDIKDRLLNKIIDRFYVNNPSGAQFLKCLFSNGRCSNNSDVGDGENAAPDAASGDQIPGDSQVQTDAKGKPSSTDLGTAAAGSEIDQTITNTVENGVTQETTDAAATTALDLSPSQKLVTSLVTVASGGAIGDTIPINPTKVWTWAKRIYLIDQLFYGADHASKVVKMVLNARRSQLEGLFATYKAASDQLKSGQLVGDELNSFFDTTRNISNSEGWDVVTGRAGDTLQKVGAEPIANPSKNAYCNTPIDKRDDKFGPDSFAWFCDDQKPSDGGRAATITDAYDASIGKITHPIALAVGVVDNSVVGSVLNFANDFVSKATSLVTDPVINALMDSGIGKDLKSLMGTAMLKLLGFLGAGPVFDGTQPGLGNLLIAGAASKDENNTRFEGGVKQTPATKAYTDQIALNYEKNQAAKMSVYDRYASLNNPQSLASTTLFALASNTRMSNMVTQLSSSISSIPKFIGMVFTGRAFAAQTQSPDEVADWAGVPTYDVPQQCQDLDVLGPGYASNATNAGEILAKYGKQWTQPDIAVMRDYPKFSAAVYAAIGKDDNAEEIANQIYDCAAFDAVTMGNLGAVYGYDDGVSLVSP